MTIAAHRPPRRSHGCHGCWGRRAGAVEQSHTPRLLVTKKHHSAGGRDVYFQLSFLICLSPSPCSLVWSVCCLPGKAACGGAGCVHEPTCWAYNPDAPKLLPVSYDTTRRARENTAPGGCRLPSLYLAHPETQPRLNIIRLPWKFMFLWAVGGRSRER